MYDYIKIGSWRSDSVLDLHVMDWDAPLLAPADYGSAQIPGRMTALRDAQRNFKPATITINMAITGDDEQDILIRHRAISKTLWDANHLILSDLPDHHFRGHVSEVVATDVVEEWLRFRVKFMANPPCRLRVLGVSSGWIPSQALPIPEQITSVNMSYTLALTGSTSAVMHDNTAPFRPEVYLAITGTWSSLQINGSTGLILPAKAAAGTVYIDCEAERCYTISDGAREPLPGVRGSYAAISGNPIITITATGGSGTARVLAIERS